MNYMYSMFDYWETAANDKDVDKKYICDIESDLFAKVLQFEGKVLDIGCGVGRLMKEGWYGIDISPSMIKIAKTRVNGKFKVNDGRTLPYKDNFFDASYCVLVFQHLPFEIVESYINEAHRVTKKHFVFQFIDGNEDEPFSKHHELSKVLKTLRDKFKIVEIKSGYIHPLWTWIICEKL